MSWIELHITTTADYAEELTQELHELEASAITLKDAGDQPIFEPSPSTPRIWNETTIVALFAADQDIEPVLSYLKSQEAKISKLETHSIPDEDWVRRSLDSFTPLSFGSRLWICPSWHTPPEPTAVNVILDPGLAFGTGTHPTTALCLEWLDEHLQSPDLVIDYGCGSGILGVAAFKLGAKKVIAVDNDPQALIATVQNAEQNGITSDDFKVQLSDEPLHAQADILLANILAQPLVILAEKLASLVKPGSSIVLSGILEDQAQQVLEIYQRWFTMHDILIKGDWVRLSGTRKI